MLRSRANRAIKRCKYAESALFFCVFSTFRYSYCKAALFQYDFLTSFLATVMSIISHSIAPHADTFCRSRGGSTGSKGHYNELITCSMFLMDFQPDAIS